MPFASLEATADQLRGYESAFLQRFDDNELVEHKRAQALEDLKYDLMRAVDTTDAATLDKIATDHGADLVRALVFKQLHLAYVDELNGEGSVNDAKAKYYRTCYEREAQHFRTLLTLTNGNRARATSVQVTL